MEGPRVSLLTYSCQLIKTRSIIGKGKTGEPALRMAILSA
ncbi:MAG: hypothetical protein K0S58_2526 [Nitrospira sp.]|jgi:hypothetical protein|nr:hypothetical protein [Nitrospira sp.]